ncbi:hypothetical protein JZO70_09195 [Enterococcus sp. 669A]|uniref:DUF4367 domain-containing protein n=1 Tax=Candidatus Enterococcus moelleringii TaxID=2815325 RepID=A0ABS3LD89_9ENTE|nr:hypothetical protein [Enterococcus sp. 669A]MBO1306334.1 hypothetical protein [Enterococcus sp. 669A]
MTKKYEEHPLGKLSDEELDQILENYGSDYSAKNKENIKRKAKMKTRKPVVKVTFSKSRLLLVAVIVLFFLPVGTYVAAKLWEINVEKKNYELTTKIDKPAEQLPDTGYYRLEAGYVPEYFTVNDEPYFLSFYEELTPEEEEALENVDQVRSIQFMLYELNGKNIVIDDYVKDFKEIKLSNGSGYLIEKTDSFGVEEPALARVFFEKQNRFVEMECYGDISEKDIKKIMDNISLVNVASFEEATLAAEYTSLEEKVAEMSEGLNNIEPLDSNNKEEVVQLNEPIVITDSSGAPMDEVTVVKATLSDKIAPEALAILNEYPEEEQQGKAPNVTWDKKGRLKPFTAVRYQPGDGKQRLDEKIEEVEIEPQYLEIELTIKNVTEDVKDVFFYTPVQRLAKQGNQFSQLRSETFLARKTAENKDIPSSVLTNYYQPLPTEDLKEVELGMEEDLGMQSIAPGETTTIKASYILADEEYSNLFLDFSFGIPGNRYIQLTQ